MTFPEVEDLTDSELDLLNCSFVMKTERVAFAFERPDQSDVLAKKTSVKSMIRACKGSSVASCKCASDPEGAAIKSVLGDATETFFCLPSECECEDGTTEEILPMAIDPIAETYVAQVNQLCGCGPPESCSCQRKKDQSPQN